MKETQFEICVIGLGYVGLPLAMAFGQKYKTYGVDINNKRIEQLKDGHDKNSQVSIEELKSINSLQFETVIPQKNSVKRYYIITVPTTIDENKKPDLSYLKSASESVGEHLKVGDIVIYESTVYPGCTEEYCIPILEKVSNLKFNSEFYVGYSPERINPGDSKRKLRNIIKVTSGSNIVIADEIDQLYRSIIEAGTFKAKSIKVAEAAKLIENCQRDVNISFMNELALIFDRLNISTRDVLEAAKTKWNFLDFTPGLVGGHCISVDPYYMIAKAEQHGYYPDLIGAGRRINDNMGVFVASKCVKLMISKGLNVKGAKALILGITFKENCSDIRNTKVIDIYNELNEYGLQVDIHDPLAIKSEVNKELGVELTSSLHISKYSLIIIAVPHKVYDFELMDLSTNVKRVVYDVYSRFSSSSDGNL
ncbi:nucleotide sugar dehydrogenase [Jiulongibacter sp. NS-SX5]|uniref:nucleotide sugar dehydrogenase n=1 Tax=Jiulongibacter sp. NS-SX5 TaxID=3463854 RepID=UPI004059AF65